MDNSPLAKLPQELQDRIYAYALTYDGALHFGFDIVDYTCYPTLVHTNAAAALAPLLHGLPRTCTASPAPNQIGYYSFNFAMQAVGEFFDELGRRGCENVKTVQLDAEMWDLDWLEEESMLDVSAFAQGLSRRLGKERARVTVAMRFEMEDFVPVEGLEEGVWACVSVTPGKVEESVAAARTAVEVKGAEQVEMDVSAWGWGFGRLLVLFQFLNGEVRAARLAGVRTIEAFGVALEKAVRTMTAVQLP
ncbi:hypothetical protein LTR74_005544 [Friedmanniomyces endolithicus]|nr:hypothetical protein LTR74_005544 [Friedmanniomyces endolithicus]